MQDGQECEFFGTKHYQAEASHSIKSPEMEESIMPVLDTVQRAAAMRMVDRTFFLFDDWSTSLLRFATENDGEHHLAHERMVRQSKALLPNDGTVLQQQASRPTCA